VRIPLLGLALAALAAIGVVAVDAPRAQQPGARQAEAQDPYAHIPDPDSLPNDPWGQLVRQGRDLITETYALIGPNVADPAMRYAGNNLACGNCHLRAGTKRFGLPLAGIYGLFPQYTARMNRVVSLEDRVNSCMTRSLNGRALPETGPEMRAIVAYVRFVSAREPVGTQWPGAGAPHIPLPDRAADPARGAPLYARHCAECHQSSGLGVRRGASDATEGYMFPPLWGPDSFNDGAGMARNITMAQYIHANMPLGASAGNSQLTVEEAFDIAAYVNSQPRPRLAGLYDDFPDRWLKPVDAAYPPWLGGFSAAQHQFGPWPPIIAWMRANQPR
jgi:thiosulfate dehydrogenase